MQLLTRKEDDVCYLCLKYLLRREGIQQDRLMAAMLQSFQLPLVLFLHLEVQYHLRNQQDSPLTSFEIRGMLVIIA